MIRELIKTSFLALFITFHYFNAKPRKRLRIRSASVHTANRFSSYNILFICVHFIHLINGNRCMHSCKGHVNGTFSVISVLWWIDVAVCAVEIAGFIKFKETVYRVTRFRRILSKRKANETSQLEYANWKCQPFWFWGVGDCAIHYLRKCTFFCYSVMSVGSRFTTRALIFHRHL